MKLSDREIVWNKFLKGLVLELSKKPYGISLFDETKNPCHEVPFTAISPITICTREIKIWDLSGMQVMKNFPSCEDVGLHGEAKLEYHGHYGSTSFSISPIVTISTGKTDPSTSLRATYSLWQFYAMTGIDLRETMPILEPVVFDQAPMAVEWMTTFWEKIAQSIDDRMAAWAIMGGLIESIDPEEAIESLCKVIEARRSNLRSSCRKEGKNRYEIVFFYRRRFFREDANVEISFLMEPDDRHQVHYWRIHPRRAEVTSPDGMVGECLRENIPAHMKTMFLLMSIDAMVYPIINHVDACEAVLAKKDAGYEAALIADAIADQEAALTGVPRWT